MSDYLDSRVQLHNIEDVEAFLNHCMRRAGLAGPPNGKLTEDQHRELFCEALVLLYDMAGKFTTGSFYGWAITYMPRKIKHAWHTMHETHVLVSHAGRRSWHYYQPPDSYDQLTSQADNDAPRRTLNERQLRTPGDFVKTSAFTVPT